MPAGGPPVYLLNITSLHVARLRFCNSAITYCDLILLVHAGASKSCLKKLMKVLTCLTEHDGLNYYERLLVWVFLYRDISHV